MKRERWGRGKVEGDRERTKLCLKKVREGGRKEGRLARRVSGWVGGRKGVKV